MLTSILKNKVFKYSLTLFLISSLMFVRTFMGIYIFGFRLGEFAMGITFLILLITLINYKKLIYTNYLSKEFYVTLILICVFFIVNAIIAQSSFFSPYTYKTSSYIWTIGMLFLGANFFKHNYFNPNVLRGLYFILIFIYIYGTYGIPQTLIDYILKYSDKFEPHKGSDILIIFVGIFFINNRYFKNKRVVLEIFILFSCLYLPLFGFKSRGAFIAFLIFVVTEFYYLRKEFISSYKRNLLLFVFSFIVLFQSVFIINGSSFLEFNKAQENVKNLVEYRADPDEEEFRILFLEEDYWTKEMRFKSSDNNLNWRLQIWQDVYFSLIYRDQILTGYGYSFKIPAMEIISRQGLDGLNENVHNYLVTIYARGGLVHLSLFGFFYYFLIRDLKRANNSLYFLPLLIAILFTALFDVAMENSHYPLLFYFLIGMSIHKNRLFKNI